MSPTDPVKLARQGDPTAIALVLNRAMPAPGVTVRVHLEAPLIKVLLEAEEVPSQRDSLPYVRQVLTRLALPQIETALVYGRQQGERSPAWTVELALSPQAPVPAPSLRSAALQPAQPAQPFTFTVADLQQLLAGLDPLKAGFLALLAVYGWFGAGNYTVFGALEGRDPVMNFLHGVNLIFHEAGHTFFSLFGQFLHILGGSLMQVMVPAGIAVYFFWKGQRYASTIALCWAAQSLWDVSIYIKDAQERDLPLLGGEGVLHDWHFLLLDLNLLRHDQAVGGFVFGLGSLLYLLAIALGFYYARKQITRRDDARI